MFDPLGGSFFDALHQIARVTEWGSFSLGAIAVLVALGWFVAVARPIAIAGVITVLAAFGGVVYGDHTGRADVQAQWDKADKAAQVIADAHNQAVRASVRAEYNPQIASLSKQSDDLKQQVAAYEKQLAAAKGSKSGAPSCTVGAAVLQLRARTGH